MTFGRLALSSVRYYGRPNAAVALGIAGAVTVLAGSLLVGASVRDSLREITTSRLGSTSVVVAGELPFTEQLGARVAAATSGRTAPLLSLTGLVRLEGAEHRAGDVNVYGVDARFFEFHGVAVPAPASNEVLLSPELAAELGASSGSTIVVRVPRITDVPLDSLHGRRDDAGRSIRLTVREILSQDRIGRFSLAPGQSPVRAVFVSLARLQRDLGLTERVNTVLVDGNPAPDGPGVRTAVVAAANASDLGLRRELLTDADSTVVESVSGLISDDLATKISRVNAANGRLATPALTWLANQMTVDSRTVPYSLVTAIGPDAAGDAKLAALLAQADGPIAPIVLNEWAARELNLISGATSGKTLDLEYFRWADEGRLITGRATFRVAGVVPMTGLAVDRRLAPDYPGITTATNLADWDPPFPIDLTLIRKQDEEYWDKYRTAPKAFIPLAAGQALWKTRYGQVSSIRFSGTSPLTLDGLADPSGPIRVVDVKSQNLAASAGATDFGAYFSYFSFFLMVSALLLSALFFRLAVEQRLPQVGVLRATGFSIAAIRRVLLLEGAIVTAVGVTLGVLFAVAWARLMMLALATLWVGAVGTTELELHVDPVSLLIGAGGAATAALVSLFLSVRALSRSSPRAQLAGWLPLTQRGSGRRAQWLMWGTLLPGIAMSAGAAAGRVPEAGGFFAAGALVLVGGLAAFRVWISGRTPAAARPRLLKSLTGLGLRNAAWRPGRSLTAAGLVAAAVFLLVAVDSFRKTSDASSGPNSGTGGFELVAETELPVVNDLRAEDGRNATNLSLPSGVTVHPFRLRPGDDTSCLNLYQPKQPRVIGVPDRFVQENRFRFARLIDSVDQAARANPWTLLGAADAQGRIPAIVDQTSLQYVLHASVGDVLTIDADSSRPIDLLIVASLDDSVLQGEIMVSEGAFRNVFPQVAGYRMFLVGIDNASPSRVDEVSGELEQALESFGFDAQSTRARLAAFHRVENTYLSTFQALGGLGLVLGCLGLVAVVGRNVFERRRELALLGASGFTGRQLQQLVAIEHVAIVGAGLLIGLVAAAIAIAPVIISRSGAEPWRAMIWIVPVAIAGFGAAYAATIGLRKLPLLASLRSE